MDGRNALNDIDCNYAAKIIEFPELLRDVDHFWRDKLINAEVLRF